MRLIFDIESNGLLDEMTKIHCIGIKDIDTNECSWFTPDNVTEGINCLEKADEIIGHNVVGFDIPAIQKLFPNFKPKKAIDTLVLGRLAFPNLKDNMTIYNVGFAVPDLEKTELPDMKRLSTV